MEPRRDVPGPGDAPFQPPRERLVPRLAPGIDTVIASMGRTEDVKLSPNNRLLAVAGYETGKLFLFSIAIDLRSSSPQVHLGGCLVLVSRQLVEPHGVSFLGDDHLFVCNRVGDAGIFRIPPPITGIREVEISPVATVSGRGTLLAKVKSPGSAHAYRLTADSFRVLVCNNHWNFISSHRVHLNGRVTVDSDSRLTDSHIQIPDGISVSPDHRWFAVSSHANGQVLVYRTADDLSTVSEPSAVLGGSVCPHGVRFVSDDTIMVADAASPYLHLYRRDGAEWRGTRHEPSQSVCVIATDRFFDGHYAAGEGGVKGLDIDRSGGLLITTTNRHDPLGFHDFPNLLRRADEPPRHLYAELCRQRNDAVQARHAATLGRRWTVRQRVTHAVRARQEYLRELVDRVHNRVRLLPLTLRNRIVRRPILDPGGPTVSLTTHPHRVARAHFTIEAIARGALKPGRLILWVTDASVAANLPAPLKRLQRRGLEVRLGEELGPHTKYFPYLESTELFDQPLVTADDDIVYPRTWLQDLVRAHVERPEHIHCGRVRRMSVAGSELTPYNDWPLGTDDRASCLNFITGVGGVIYPAAFLARLKQAGRGFVACCPTADDIWLTVHAIRFGVAVRQVGPEALHPPTVPKTQGRSLSQVNLEQGANQVQLRRTFTPDDLAILCAELRGGTQLQNRSRRRPSGVATARPVRP